MKSHPVFISYARKTSRKPAEALHRELGGEEGLAFLDKTDIEAGELLPKALVDALLDSKVVVVFADETYFNREYCRRELQTALAPLKALLNRGAPSEEQKAAALAHLVIALPQGGPANLLDNLPPLIQQQNWRMATETAALAQLVNARLASIEASIRDRLGDREADAIQATMLAESALPAPMNLSGVPQFPLALPRSLGESFVGRADDLWRIHFTLSTMRGEPAASAALSGALEGGGGFGKTRLALEYLHRFGGHYPGGLFWVDADVSPEALQERLHGILKTLKPETPDLYALREQFRQSHKDDLDGFTRELGRRLAEALHTLPTERPVLFVVDNVPEAPTGERPQPLETWCPALGKVAVLVTSRAKLLDSGLESLPVDTLDPKSAVVLMTQGVDRASLAQASWERIAEWVGNLPLALELLREALKVVISPRELLDLAASQAGPARILDRQMKALCGQVPEGSLRGVTEALRISYEKLPEKTRKAARLIALLSPERIPLEIINALGAKVFTPDVKAALISRSFVTPLPADGAAAWFGRMHRVLADFLRSCSRARGRETRVMCDALVGVMDPDACHDPKSWPLMNACRPHAEWLLARVDPTKVRGFGEAIIVLRMRVGILLDAEGLSERARTMEELTVQLAQSLLGQEHPKTLTSMNNLAGIIRDQGELARARQLQERVLAVQRRTRGGKHPETLRSMNNLAMTLRAQGELAGARKLQERVLERVRRVEGEEHPHTLTAMSNLAATLIEQHDLAGARKLAERVLELRRRVGGEEHPHTLTAMHNLAQMLYEQGELVGARKLAERVLEARRRVEGEEHPHTLTAMNNLAATLSEQHDLAGARELEERALEICRRTLGEAHPHTLATMNNLATTLSKQDDLAGARELQERVLEARRRVEGEEHPHTLTAMNNLAATLSEQHDLAGARELEERALEICRRVLGEAHPNTLKSMNILAGTLKAQGDLVGTRKLLERGLEVCRRELGKEHPETSVTAWNLSQTLAELDERAAGQRIIRDLLSWLLKRDPTTLHANQQNIREMLNPS